MDEKIDLTKKIIQEVMAKKIRILGIAIIVGMALILILGSLLPFEDTVPEFKFIGIISLFVCIIFCVPTLHIRKLLLKKVNKDNLTKTYFNAYFIPYALCDFGGLFCIVSNLFINREIIYAAIGFIVAIVFIILNFPKLEDDYTV